MKKKHSDFVWFIYFAWLVVSILGLAGAHAEDIAFETSEIWVESGSSQYHFFVEIAETRPTASAKFLVSTSNTLSFSVGITRP